MKKRCFSFAGPVALLIAGLALGGASAQTKLPRQKTPPQNPIDAIRNFKLRADPVEPAEFVRKSRPPEDQLQFIPIGAPKPEPATRPMTLDELRARETDLDGVRARHDRIGARAAPAGPPRSVALAPKPPPEKKKRNCLITCIVDPTPTRD